MSTLNITITDLQNAGYVLHDFVNFYTVEQLLNAGYTMEDLNKEDIYEKIDSCINDVCLYKQYTKNLRLSSSTNNTQICSKMLYSQNISNKSCTFTTDYTNYTNYKNPSSTTKVCYDANSQKTNSSLPSTANACKQIFNNLVSESSYLNTYIYNSVKNSSSNMSEVEIQEHITNIQNLLKEYPNIPVNTITNDYIYIIIRLNIPYSETTSYIITYNTMEDIRTKYPSTVDEEMQQYITDIINIKKENPEKPLSDIITEYTLEIRSI